MNDTKNVIAKVRRSLGRTQPLSAPPTPPALDEPSVRLVLSDIGLPALFESKAKENKIGVTSLRVESLHESLVEYLRRHVVKSVALPRSKFLDRLEIPRVLREAGFAVSIWEDMTLDQL
jgi:hypothetical protein